MFFKDSCVVLDTELVVGSELEFSELW